MRRSPGGDRRGLSSLQWPRIRPAFRPHLLLLQPRLQASLLDAGAGARLLLRCASQYEREDRASHLGRLPLQRGLYFEASAVDEAQASLVQG